MTLNIVFSVVLHVCITFYVLGNCSCQRKLQVTAVGMATEWGKLMATISEDNDEETPLQVGIRVEIIFFEHDIGSATLVAFPILCHIPASFGEVRKYTSK